MPLYLQSDSGDQLPLATNAGWSALGKWIDSLPSESCADLVHLWEYRWSEPAGEVHNQLAHAFQVSRPADPLTAKTASELLDSLGHLSRDAALVVSDGMGSDDVTEEVGQSDDDFLEEVGQSDDDILSHFVNEARAARNEGETWQVGSNFYTKRNGKIVKAADPAKKAQPKAPTKKDQKAQAGAAKADNKAKAMAAAAKLAKGGGWG